MNRRDFIRCVGVAGYFLFLGTIPLHGSAPTDSDAAGLKGPFDVAFDSPAISLSQIRPNTEWFGWTHPTRCQVRSATRFGNRSPEFPERSRCRPRRAHLRGGFQQLPCPSLRCKRISKTRAWLHRLNWWLFLDTSRRVRRLERKSPGCRYKEPSNTDLPGENLIAVIGDFG